MNFLPFTLSPVAENEPPILVNPSLVDAYIQRTDLLLKQSQSHPNHHPVLLDNEIITEPPPSKKRSKKTKSTEVEKPVPTIYNLKETNTINYTVAELKQYLKTYGLVQTGTKQVIHERLFSFIKSQRGVIKLQAIFRGILVRTVYRLFDKYQKMVADCVNDQDFYSFEPLKEINKFQLMCVKEGEDGPTYGFDISSIYQYRKKLESDAILTNPYNRNEFSGAFLTELSKIVIASNKSIIPTVLDIEPEQEMDELSFEKKVEMRAVSLFQHINSLGNYSDASWFLNLSTHRTIRMIQELYDIWRYRLHISRETKNNICPPHGNPFGNAMQVHIGSMSHNEIKNLVLSILENFVFKGVDRDAKCLGAFYVLGALTIVSTVAAESAPWLYQSFAI